MEMERRRVVTQRTKDAYDGREFDWRTNTCVHMLRDHLVNMGHEPPEIPEIESLADAVRALRAHGWANLTEMLDSLLEPIAPARMVLGDVAVVPGDGMEAVFICAGPLKVFGWREDEAALVLLAIDLNQISRAWRA